MPYCAPLRILYNGNNLIRTATLTPSSVMPVENTVIEIPAARTGTGSVALTGAYTGDEAATIDIQILDDSADETRASAPILIGAGSETLTDISSTGLAAQNVSVELKDAGLPIVAAAISFEGVKIVAATPGANGNNLHIAIDQSGLAFAAQDFSLLADLQAGQGGDTTGLKGAAFDWDTAALGEDGEIPASAHRISFGEDDSAIYLQYKQYVDNEWIYHFVPALLRGVPAGSVVKFVTGGRTVTITDSTGTPVIETYTGCATVYDLLHQIKESSVLVTIDGIVALDRTPTGQAARDLLVRTDAHAEPSTGSGSIYADGFENISVEAGAGTELVTARCYAVSARDHPLARLGSEIWRVTSSLRGILADAYTGIPYIGAGWGFTIPKRLPPGYGVPRGTFGVVSINYAARGTGEIEPPICPILARLGPNAIDETITLTYKTRPSGDCDCDGMAIPIFNAACLGIESTGGGSSMSFQDDTIERLKDLYDWYADTAVTNSVFGTTGYNEELFVGSGELERIVQSFVRVAALIDPLADGSPGRRSDGFAEWDAAVTQIKADVAAVESDLVSYLAEHRYSARLASALAAAGLDPTGGDNASILDSGDGCWRDTGDAHWWEVVGDAGGIKQEYAPAFSNVAYYASRRASEHGLYYSAKEFGFQLNIDCTADLKDGDTITLAIGNAAWPSTYQVGDTLSLPIIAASDLYLGGGQDGDPTQQWFVTASTAGALAVYTLDPRAPTSYSDSGLSFQINEGGIPSRLGDKFLFAIEGGHYRWRVNGGAWDDSSPGLDIPSGASSLYEGLSVTFTPGEAPSFAAGDTYSFRVLQPWAASNLQTPGPEPWKWSGATPTHLFDLGSVQDIADVAIWLHTLPQGSAITLQGADSAGSPFTADWSESLTWRAGPIFAELSTPRTARYLRLVITGATNAGIGCFYAGPPLTTTLSADLNLSRAYKIQRADAGLYEGGRSLGKAVSGTIEWTEGALPEADVAGLQTMLDWVKGNDDEPILIVPNVTRPQEAFLGRPAADEVEFPDIFSYQPNADKERRHDTRIPIAGVWS